MRSNRWSLAQFARVVISTIWACFLLFVCSRRQALVLGFDGD